ncbi:hypothetical protein [Mycobacteroides immunogenum]|uniref:Uncharacterized protein n=1 Tax=Mycobacteroides immunogenum TaxID=83262 RepID=A0A7V8RUC3_9MYCO|nr:hypothetical protein [Mycobacteroides immunogenum]AMT72937.1 hypothetical protein ABG82_24445 [Mycobacteroides immunogenum]ANO06101.1 hypothetical protein BAB75_24710 [Mycobacteroides immunogenum]KIU37701.1 hypothetical protein TL11_26170 [Mycobacteroides immunogenum]KPG02685.1 hypothetical protein AN909_27045 [Mycobacteroides immunogenum]KPG02827.1 hypothetical protein AN908_27270 [Mycobacteroides immunogenum]
MGGKRTWIPAVLIIALLVFGGVWWYQDRDTAQPKPDCDVVHELVEFKASAVKEQESLLQAGEDQQRLEKYKASVAQEQTYVDQIQDPSIRDKAQALVDADRKSLDKQTDLYNNPIGLGPAGGPPSLEERQAYEAAQKIAAQFKSAKDELLRACPAASSDPKL